MFRALLYVGLGGAIGSMARYGISQLINKFSTASFPLGTFLINIVGCFLIGLLFGYGQKNSSFPLSLWLILATGFCGGFTTFSAFALENTHLIKSGMPMIAILYTALSVAIGLFLCRIGIIITS